MSISTQITLNIFDFMFSSSCLPTKTRMATFSIARVSQLEKLCTQHCWAFKFHVAAQKSLNLWIWSTSFASLVSADPGNILCPLSPASLGYSILMAQWFMFRTFDILTLAQVGRPCLLVMFSAGFNWCVMMEVDSASELGFQHAQHHLQNGETEAAVAIAKQNVICKSQTFTKFWKLVLNHAQSLQKINQHMGSYHFFPKSAINRVYMGLRFLLLSFPRSCPNIC